MSGIEQQMYWQELLNWASNRDQPSDEYDALQSIDKQMSHFGRAVYGSVDRNF